MFLSKIIIFLAKVTNLETLFLNSPALNASIRSASTAIINITDIGSICIKDTYTNNTYTRDTYTANTFIILDAYIKGASPENISMEDINTKSAYSKGINAIKHVKTNL